MCLPKLRSVAGDVPGTVTVTITTKNGVFLGKTLFTYVDQDEEILMQIIKSRKLQGKLFTMLGKQCENDESEENNSRTFGMVKLCHSLVMSVHVHKVFQANICFKNS